MSKIGKASSTVLKATTRFVVDTYNESKKSRIKEIDEQIEKLQEERDKLVREIIED